MGQTSPLSFLIQIFIVSVFAFGLASGNVTCSFETGLCGWNVTADSNFKWLINTGNAGDRTSGLESDHTCGNIRGAYLYIRGQDAHNSTWVAKIQSQKIDLNETTNLTFWYHMNGNGIGTLSLYMITPDNITSNNVSTMLWSRCGRQSLDWLEATVVLKPGIFQLQFCATTREHFASDIGLDDIWLLLEPKDNDDDLTDLCKIPTTTTTPTTPTAPKTITTTTSKRTTAAHMAPCGLTYSNTDLLSGSCDFENGWCNLSEVVNKDYTVKWNITSGSVGAWSYRMSGDHTKPNGLGKYAYLPLNSSTLYGLRAGLTTPSIPYPVCLTFWYRVADREAKLFVFLQNQDNSLTLLWSYNHPTDWTIKFPQPWTRVETPVLSTQPFSIVFQAITNGVSSAVGIDDISIQGKPLSTFTQSRSSTTLSTIHTIETIGSMITTGSHLTRTSNIVTLATSNHLRNSSLSGTTHISSTVTTKQFPTRTSNSSTTFDRSTSVGSLLTIAMNRMTSVSPSTTKRTSSSFISSLTTPVPTPTSVTSIYNEGSTLYHATTSNGNPYFSNPLASTSTNLRIETLKTEHPLKSTTYAIATPEIVTYSKKLETFSTSESTKTTTLKSSLLTDTTKKNLSTDRYLSTESVTDNQSFLAENGMSIKDRYIIGGVIGGCLFVVLVVLIIIIYFRKIRTVEELKRSTSELKRYKEEESDDCKTDSIKAT